MDETGFRVGIPGGERVMVLGAHYAAYYAYPTSAYYAYTLYFPGGGTGATALERPVPEAFSSPSKQSYSNWLTGAAQVLAAGQL
ncbi:hypothetical protein V496_00134 [Pseudogymnoascus sp. VKM F-4515 (FW-2607)]|nr:hypothetical protein V496_00134 [Pseudogymnoascus sp. VKM F-4515 (FW-2607)]